MDATFYAMELGRFRAIAPQNAIISKDYSWLEFLEVKIQERYFQLDDSSSTIHLLKGNIIQKYTSALQEHQASFYGNHYAVCLLSFLLKDSQLGGETAQMLSLEGVCLSTCPLQNLTIPADQSYGNDNNYIMKQRWKLVVKRIFFGFLDNKINNNAVISKFLTYTERIDDPKFADLVYRVLEDYSYLKEFTFPEQRISCFKFLLQVHKHSQYEVSPYMLSKSFVDVGLQIQAEFLGFFLPNWQELCPFFSGQQLAKIVKVITEDYIKSVDNLPKTTIDMLLRHFEAPFKHSEESVEFLKCFHAKVHRHKALEKVIFNNKNYTPLALLLLAKMEHEEMDSSTLPLGDIFTKTVFSLIQEVFKRLREVMDDSGKEFETLLSDLRPCLVWFFKKIAASGKSAKHSKDINCHRLTIFCFHG
ncbi:uncharacterized protein LOC110460805 [Mizuhopecten yessoensis]|uniref:uncharacterized protein LOC110460805 n=1 Tax=Mizuhopecten yessoensis TaxID=6573 RepID=UPI000B45DAE5|nr:uncharacterized protein LOC110460805 [Mizuhopecten yessoensis]